ncbi:p1/s1 nuclease, putative [Plasmodium reichenowi]|uniref:p1/s1 nuclease, putative n=1 Tax=Plasmodium reichenowi TaxID=5854 RepID=A0A060RZ94_PLARE|nr:p1/s1 nuclease, putative [Plasmodium reichenowi]KYN93779.1 p1/s1 nuclease, putative [Plasmodium reichenowi]CDO66603.1 p1/s1 nuclease, putative [Plasmodium reichenowi]SOV82624.1 p1/s1 nuclease, putative [Plasmodium reichenowi]
MSNIFVIFCTLLILIFTKRCSGWCDEGHMLVSAIAYNFLNDDEKTVLDRIFKNYKEDNDFNDPVLGSVWPDHIKYFNYNYPNKIRRIDGLELMNKWHYVNIPYNPTNIKLNMFQKEYYKRTDNAITILKSIFKSLKNVKKKENHGTFFSYNFLIRYFIHIFGDIHQPLHSLSFYNKNFPEGDRGGTDIFVMYNNKVENLHYLCDSVFRARNQKWPYLNSDMINKEAQKLMKIYPKEYFADRLKQSEFNNYSYIDFIISETFDLAVEYIYSNFPHDTLDQKTTYLLNDYAVINIKKMLTEQIVLAGYRLTHYLKIIIQNVPTDLVNTN